MDGRRNDSAVPLTVNAAVPPAVNAVVQQVLLHLICFDFLYKADCL
jgi:hypothetical protein